MPLTSDDVIYRKPFSTFLLATYNPISIFNTEINLVILAEARLEKVFFLRCEGVIQARFIIESQTHRCKPLAIFFSATELSLPL